MSQGSPKVSCAIFTLNEGINLPKCLKSLSWCKDIVVIDSYSSDDTAAICKKFGAKFVQHPFTGFGDQRNWALDKITFKNEWVFMLDADEEFTSELVEELVLRLSTVSPGTSAFRVKRRFYLWGKWLKYSSLYPTWVIRLIRVGKVRYVNRGHAETQMVDGAVEALEADLKDENLKGLHAWFARQNDYSTKEALHEVKRPVRPVLEILSSDPFQRREAIKSIAGRVPLRPLLFFLYNYIVRRGFMDGVAGFRFSVMKAIYTNMIELKKYEIKSYPDLYREPVTPPKKLRKRA